MKKTAFQTIAEAVGFNKLGEVDLPTERVDRRKLSIDEIKQFIVEEYKAAKEAVEKDKAEKNVHWGDAEIANQINWMKKLQIKEYFELAEAEECPEDAEEEE